MNADDLSEQKRRTMSPLRWERVRRGLNIRDVCAELGISGTSVLANWETCRWSPSIEEMQRVAAFYGARPEDLFGDSWHMKQGRRSAARERHRAPEPTPKRTPVSKPARRIVPREVVAIVDDVAMEPEPVSLLRRKLREMSA